MIVLAQAAVKHMETNNTELDFELNLTIQDVRMAMQDCGALLPQKSLEEEEFEGEEDMRGVENFVAWATGKVNREIRRVALEGADATKEDYLTVLKKKHGTTDEESRYTGTILGKPAEPRAVKIEGGDIASMGEWLESLKKSKSKITSVASSRPASSDLSSLVGTPAGLTDDMEF